MLEKESDRKGLIKMNYTVPLRKTKVEDKMHKDCPPACIICGNKENLSHYVHTDKKNRIVGKIFCCDNCEDILERDAEIIFCFTPLVF